MIAWTPYSIFALSEQFGDPELITPTLAVLPALVAKSSICYNPLIYVGKKKFQYCDQIYPLENKERKLFLFLLQKFVFNPLQVFYEFCSWFQSIIKLFNLQVDVYWTFFLFPYAPIPSLIIIRNELSGLKNNCITLTVNYSIIFTSFSSTQFSFEQHGAEFVVKRKLQPLSTIRLSIKYPSQAVELTLNVHLQVSRRRKRAVTKTRKFKILVW